MTEHLSLFILLTLGLSQVLLCVAVLFVWRVQRYLLDQVAQLRVWKPMTPRKVPGRG